MATTAIPFPTNLLPRQAKMWRLAAIVAYLDGKIAGLASVATPVDTDDGSVDISTYQEARDTLVAGRDPAKRYVATVWPKGYADWDGSKSLTGRDNGDFAARARTEFGSFATVASVRDTWNESYPFEQVTDAHARAMSARDNS